jgi:RimJ/RimL family protein N-acetyltransferase
MELADDFVGIGREIGGKLVAAFGYNYHRPDWCFMHICLEPQGLNRRVLRMAFDVPFRQWGYEYVIALIEESNKRCLKLAASFGFKEFDIIPRVSRYAPARFFIMHKSDCKWLDLATGRA